MDDRLRVWAWAGLAAWLAAGCGGGGGGDERNAAPVAAAVALPADDGITGETVTLDGTASSDPEGGALTFSWTVLSVPPFSQITGESLMGASASIASFVPDALGEYVVQLEVEDPAGRRSAPVAVHVTARGAWRAAQSLAGAGGGPSLRPVAALDGQGNGFAAWEQSDALGEFSIYGARYPRGSGGWGDAELLEAASGGASMTRVAADGEGAAVAIWHQDEVDAGGDLTGDVRVHWARFDGSSVQWETGGPALNGSARGFSDRLQLSARGAGHAVAVWEQADTDGQGAPTRSLFAARYDPSAGWLPAQRVEAEDGPVERPQVGLDGDGNAFCLWLQEGAAGVSVYAARQAPGSSWQTARLEIAAEQAARPSLCVNDRGDAVAVWCRRHPVSGLLGLRAARFAGGVWGAPRGGLSDPSREARFPRVALDGAGNAVAVWEEEDTDTLENTVRAARGLWDGAQETWQPAVRPYEGPAPEAGEFEPVVAATPGGDAVVVWRRGADIVSARYEGASGAFGAAEALEQETGEVALVAPPSVAVDPSGRVLAVWEQVDITRTPPVAAVRAAVFE